ncbi:CgeB family protein [Falsiroseomonas oryzae]|uniref:CgeB family protein n=1 Tax=Falsiroseomonas oryzae TaxID=2766473 RepID=UPI0022EB7255|nr:glycosyltransferase [Roseomonas sp. MO-31]
MRFVWFTHSLRSCWNHGNAHFLRGVLRALQARGHSTLACEPAAGWSAANLLREHGAPALDGFSVSFPDLAWRSYACAADLAALVQDADVVVVHEWNEPWLVAALGAMRLRGARFTLLFHDTHHRAVSDPDAIRAFDLDGYDGVLAFGEALAEVYRAWGWGARVTTWHEAADTTVFHPPAAEGPREGLVWIGNWGDGERAAEIEEFLLRPARAAGLPLDIHGVRYPADALRRLAAHGARYHGWLPNAQAPAVFARHLATLHVPRRYYATLLPGIPTIRVFEALACGIPLVSASWEDSEGLFRPGEDFLVARDGAEATRHLRALAAEPALRARLAANGLATIRARHSCDHRAAELLAAVARLGTRAEQAA